MLRNKVMLNKPIIHRTEKMVKNENDYEKRKLLIEAAKKEFLEKGYNKASLRNICAKAGMTTGALYFFFDNKEKWMLCRRNNKKLQALD